MGEFKAVTEGATGGENRIPQAQRANLHAQINRAGGSHFGKKSITKFCSLGHEVLGAWYGDLMADIDPKFLESLKKAHGPGWQPELVKETEWSYVYKIGEKSYHYVSKFLADENFTVSASEVRERWPTMGENDRLDFALHFWNKKYWTSKDTELLEIVMQDGNDRICGNLRAGAPEPS